MPISSFTEEDNKIIKENFGKLTLNQILKLLTTKHSYYAMRSHCQRMGLYRDRSKVKLPIKSLHDTEFFSRLNVLSAYYAGLVASDGCVAIDKHNTYTYGHKVSIKDEELINNFVKNIKFTGKISKTIETCSISKYKTKCPMVYFKICCFDKNALALKKYYNIVPQKTFRLGPTNLSYEDLNFAFLLGAIDGDGSVEFRQQKVDGNYYDSFSISLSSCSQPILDWAKQLVDNKIKYSFHGRNSNLIHSKRDKSITYYIHGVRAAILADYLRQINVPKLDRKWNRPEVIEYINKVKGKHPEEFFEFKGNDINIIE